MDKINYSDYFLFKRPKEEEEKERIFWETQINQIEFDKKTCELWKAKGNVNGK